MATIRVAIYRVGAEMEVRDIPAGLKSCQEIVGGYIEAVTLPDGLTLVCNEEGFIHGLPPNRTYRFHNDAMGLALGDFFVCRTGEDKFAGLTDEDIQRLPSHIGDPQ